MCALVIALTAVNRWLWGGSVCLIESLQNWISASTYLAATPSKSEELHPNAARHATVSPEIRQNFILVFEIWVGYLRANGCLARLILAP